MPFDIAPNPCPPRFRTGRQIVAARALVGWRRVDLANAAGLHFRSVAYWEGRDHHPRREPFAVERMRKALAMVGVVTIGTREPGVFLRAKPVAELAAGPVEDASPATDKKATDAEADWEVNSPQTVPETALAKAPEVMITCGPPPD